MIHIVGCLEAGVVLDELGMGDVGVSRVQMREYLTGGDVGIANVAGLDSTEEHVIDSTDEELFSALLVLSYSLNISWDSSCARRMEEVCEAVAAEEIVALEPGLVGGTKRVADRVA